MERFGAMKLVHGRRAVVAAAAGCAALALLALPADARAPALTASSRVSTQGLGPVRIGMTKGQAERAAGTRIEVVPREARDANRRVIFETDGPRVTMIRAGRLPEVPYIEGCA